MVPGVLSCWSWVTFPGSWHLLGGGKNSLVFLWVLKKPWEPERPLLAMSTSEGRIVSRLCLGHSNTTTVLSCPTAELQEHFVLICFPGYDDSGLQAVAVVSVPFISNHNNPLKALPSWSCTQDTEYSEAESVCVHRWGWTLWRRPTFLPPKI
jgi:hypothetical protein